MGSEGPVGPVGSVGSVGPFKHQKEKSGIEKRTDRVGCLKMKGRLNSTLMRGSTEWITAKTHNRTTTTKTLANRGPTPLC